MRNHADVAARRAVLTGLSQYTGKISERNAEELDTDIVEVTAHAGARPDHAEWQGRWYSLSGKSKKYPSLVEVTGYGTGAGLKGWNCRHDFYPVIDGISEPSYTEEELQNIDPPPFEYEGKTYTYYEATQRQRYMERSMRKTKREILAADATGDKDRFTEKSVLLRRQREEYGKLSKAAGLLTQNQRTQVDGFGHSQAGKAVWAEKKALNQKYQQRMHNLGINNPPKSLDKFNEMKYNNTPEYQVMSKYISSVESGMLSPLAGFDKYKEYYENIENNVIGKTTSNGIVITGQTQHFLERIFGTKSDPNHNGMPRSGVALDDAIDALLNGKERPIKEEMLPDGTKRRSQILYSKKCSVSINPDTGIIIQCQPT